MTSETAKLWDAEAATFDAEPDHGLSDPAVRRAWAALLAECIPEPSTVLDVGCGTGSLSVLLVAQGHTVTGLDFSPGMLELARAKAARHGIAASFLLGDAAQPPVDPGFDVVLVRHVLWALPDRSAALDRWLALLKEHGTLVLIEGVWDTGAGLSASAITELLEPRVSRLSHRPLDDPALWGRAITDERFLLMASP